VLLRLELDGVPCTLVVTAHVRLPGDERVDVPVEPRADPYSGLALLPDVRPVLEELRRRALEHP
jgi:hypothetical protein